MSLQFGGPIRRKNHISVKYSKLNWIGRKNSEKEDFAGLDDQDT